MSAFEPQASYRFYVEITGILQGYFAECTGLSVQSEIFEYKEGGLNDYTHKLPGQTKMNNITLKRGLTRSRELWDWMVGADPNGGLTRYANMSILLYDSYGTVIRRWNLNKACAVKWTAPELKADAKAIAIESLEIAFHGLSMADS